MARPVFRARHLRRRRFTRLRRSVDALNFLETQAARLASSITEIGFFTTAAAAAIAAQGTYGQQTAAAAVDGETVTIGAHVYTFVDALTEAFATGVLTLTENAAEDNTVVIGSRTYRFKATPAQINDVDIGANASGSLDNLIAAINAGAGAGTAYFTGTTAHPDVTAAAGAGDTMDVTAKVVGTAGNAIATTDTLAGSSAWGAVTLENGVDAVADEVLAGASQTDSITNLVAAINGDAGEGTTYSTGTIAHADVTAVVVDADELEVTANVAGAAGNAIATTTTSVLGIWTAATLEGGADTVEDTELTSSSHGLTDGEGPYTYATDGDAIVGLVESTVLYWAHVVDENTFELARSREDAVEGRTITLSSEGSGTHTISKTEDPRTIFEMLRRNDPRTIEAAEDIDDLA